VSKPAPAAPSATFIQSTGITQLALPWALGGYEYGGVINQICHGWVGDVLSSTCLSRPASS
jgi:hypothetical protein